MGATDAGDAFCRFGLFALHLAKNLGDKDLRIDAPAEVEVLHMRADLLPRELEIFEFGGVGLLAISRPRFVRRELDLLQARLFGTP